MQPHSTRSFYLFIHWESRDRYSLIPNTSAREIVRVAAHTRDKNRSTRPVLENRFKEESLSSESRVQVNARKIEILSRFFSSIEGKDLNYTLDIFVIINK